MPRWPRRRNICSDIPILGKSDKANTLTISIEGSTVLHDDTPPCFIEFKPDMGWKWTIRRPAAGDGD
jgi:hypothetical protein